MSTSTENDFSGDGFPKAYKISLRMGTENVVNDLLSFSDDSWTYEDFLQAEAQIIKALQPKLNLDPKPALDKLCRKLVPKQLDLGIHKRRSTGKQQDAPETNSTFVEKTNSRSCSSFGDTTASSAQCPILEGMRHVQENDSVLGCSVSVPSNELTNSTVGSDSNKALQCSGTTKRNTKNTQYANLSFKRLKQETREIEPLQLEQEPGAKLVSTRKQQEASALLCHSVGDKKLLKWENNMSVGGTAMQEPQKLSNSVILNEPSPNVNNIYALGSRGKRSNRKRCVSNVRNSGVHVEKRPEKANPSMKRKSCDLYSVSKSVDVRRLLLGAPFNLYPANFGAEPLKDEVATVPIDSIRKVSLYSSVGAQTNLLRPKKQKKADMVKLTSQSMSNRVCAGIEDTFVDSVLQKRFSTIVMVSQRHGLNDKKVKVDKYLKAKSLLCCSLTPIGFLNTKDFEECQSSKEKMCMSNWVTVGSMNYCKARVITFLHVRFFGGYGSDILIEKYWCKLVLLESENPEEHQVGAEMVFGVEQLIHIGVFATSHHADLFAAQFIVLMARDGYKVMDDRLHCCSSRITSALRGSSADDSPDVRQ